MIVAVAVFVCVCNCWYYGCCEACCEIFESDDPPIPKSTQEVGQALTSGRMADKVRKNPNWPEFLKIQGRRPTASGMTLCYLCNTEVRSTATCKIKFLIFFARSVISSGTMEGTDATVRTPRRGKKQVIFCIFYSFLFKEGETGGDVPTCVRFLSVWRQIETMACYVRIIFWSLSLSRTKNVTRYAKIIF